MRVLHLDSNAFHHLPYLQAASRGGTESVTLPFHAGTVDALPPGVDALVLTSDLQGVAPSWRLNGAAALLGEVVVDVLEDLAEDGSLPPLDHCGAVLAGDLYSSIDGRKRGASGDVRSVWERFAESFRWVAGIAGNHDRFGTNKEQQRLSQRHNIHLLDGASVHVDGLHVAGVGQVIAPEHKLHKGGRRVEVEQLALLHEATSSEADLLVVHEGPRGVDAGQRGNAAITSLLEAQPVPLIVCGHVHWDRPLSSYAGGQILNVDARLVVLTEATR